MSRPQIYVVLFSIALNAINLSCCGQELKAFITVNQFKEELNRIGNRMDTMETGTYVLKSRARDSEMGSTDWAQSEVVTFYNSGVIVQKNEEGYLFRNDSIQVVVDLEDKTVLIMRAPDRKELDIFKIEYFEKISINEIDSVTKLTDDEKCSLKYKINVQGNEVIKLNYNCIDYYFTGFEYFIAERNSIQYRKCAEVTFEYLGSGLDIDPSFFKLGHYIKKSTNGELVAGSGFKEFEVFNTIVQ
jgi:hypothetical protein